MSLHPRRVPVSSYSSLAGAVSPSVRTPRSGLPVGRVLLPQPIWSPTGLTSGDASAYNNIAIDAIGTTTGSGCSVTDIATRGNLSNWIQNGKDLVHVGSDKIYVRIIWPGYEHVEFCRSVAVNPQTNRGQLALQVAKLVLAHIADLKQAAPKPAKKQWQVGQGRILPEHVYLASVFCVKWKLNTYQAVLHVKLR